MKRFLGFGECMVELSPAGEGLWRQGFAGDVFNTLWYARKALPDQWDVQFHTAVGDDALSSQLLEFIDTAGIHCDGVERISGKSPGLYAIHLAGGERSFTYWRSESAAREMLRSPELLWAKARNADAIFFSGISLAILPREHVQHLIINLRKHSTNGATIAFDPNIRPALWESADHMRTTIEAAAAISDILLPSFDDEARAFGDASPLHTFQRYRALGAKVVIVKNGGDDVLAGSSDIPIYFLPQPVARVVDTTAAGDSFNGAFLADWMQFFDLRSAVRAGQAKAAQVIGAAGALVETVS
jgi:2-dehydro-3-deoxygluconokinase